MHYRHHLNNCRRRYRDVCAVVQKQTFYSEYPVHGLEALSQSMNNEKDGATMRRPGSVKLRPDVQSYIRPSMGCYLSRTTKDVPEGARTLGVNL